MLDDVRASCPALRETIVLEEDWEAFLADARVRERRRAGRRARRALQFDDPINIQYTSGTTGFPKGATLSHHNILNNAYFIGARAGLHASSDRVCVPVPFYHCFGMVVGNLACATHGACVVVPGESFGAASGAGGSRGGALHLALRRADDVHRRARAAAISAASISPVCAPA